LFSIDNNRCASNFTFWQLFYQRHMSFVIKAKYMKNPWTCRMLYLLSFTIVTGCVSYKATPTKNRTMQQNPPSNTPANAHMNTTDFDRLVQRFDNPERDLWQKPGQVIALLGDLHGKAVADIGSGTGYFSIRMAKSGANVIACDVDERFLNYLKERIKSTDLGEGTIHPQLVSFDDPMLDKGSIDIAIIVNTYHHIDNRPDYFAKVKAGLKDGGRLVVIDFKVEETPMGPPLEIRVPPVQVKKELQEAGFKTFEVNDSLLPYQYIVEAR